MVLSRASITLLFLLGSVALPLPGADAPPLETWMPDDVVGYARLSGLGARLEDLLKSDLRRRLESLEAVKHLLAQEPWRRFEHGLEELRNATGKDPLELFKTILGREVLVGARFGFMGPEVIVLTRAAGEKQLEETLRSIRSAVEQRGVFLDSTKTEREGRTIETFAGKVSLLTIGEVLAVSSSASALERVVDLAAGKASGSVKSSALFQKAGDPGGALASIAVRPQFIPNFHVPDKAENGPASLLLGGWLGALGGSELLTASLAVQEGDLVLELASVLGERAREDKAWERFRSFFPEIVPDGVKERLQKRGVLAVTQIHRNLAQWWENREALLDAKAAGDLIQFSQVMSIVFGGRNFQDEILPELGPTVTIVACNQEYKDLPAKPQPAIPAFAGIFELKNAADASKDMVAAFYTLVGIINADRAQKKKEGGMSMIPRPEKVGDVDMHTVSLNLQKDAKPGLPHNFTPSMAVVGSRVVLSSSTELAKILVEELSKVSEPKTGAAGAKDSIVIDARAVHGILTDNLDVIVADNMLKNGKSRAEAEGELKAALEILPSLKDLRIESWRKDGAVRARAELRTSFGSKAVKAEPAKAGEKKTVKL